MISRLDGVGGIGHDYVTALLQLHLGLGFVIAIVSYAVGVSTELRERLSAVPWHGAIKAVEAAAAPLLLLSAYALVQLQAQAMSFLHVVALIVAGSSVLGVTLFTALVPICGGDVPEVDAVSGDVTEAGEESPQSLPKFTRFLRFLSVVKALGQLLLLSASFPGVEHSHLVCASALARLALFAEAVGAISLALGFKDGVVTPTCSDVVKVLRSTTLVSGLAIMADIGISKHMANGTDMGMVSGSIWALPFQPIFYCAVGLYSLVGITLVLDISCGGRCLAGSAADKRVATIEYAGKGVLVIGLLTSIVWIAMDTFDVRVQPKWTGLSVEWGEPLVAIAVTIASLAFLAELVDFFFYRTSDEASPAIEGKATCEKRSAFSGIAEEMETITSRASCLILALLATHITVARCPAESLDAYLMALTSPLRLGFLLCSVVILMQIVLLVAFRFSSRDSESDAIMDATGTIMCDSAKHISQLLAVGLGMSIMSMGVSVCAVVGVVIIGLVYLFLPQQGKATIIEALGWIATGLKSCFGVIGRRVDEFLEQRRKIAEAKAAERAAQLERETIAATEHVENEKAQKKSKAEPGEPKKKQPNPSPKKAASKGAKKKSSM
jgi:hypothetical protein